MDRIDSDEELGAYIYRTSRTAKLLREEAARNNDKKPPNDKKSNNIRTRRQKRKKPPEEDDNIVSAVLSKAKYVRKRCSNEGCINQSRKEGVCTRHGAMVKKYYCSQEGCNNYAQKGGVCIRHGAKRKTCSHEGCTKFAKKGGLLEGSYRNIHTFDKCYLFIIVILFISLIITRDANNLANTFTALNFIQSRLKLIQRQCAINNCFNLPLRTILHSFL